jgi:ribonuclease G
LPEWLIERGIGETRAALIEDGEIVEARIHLDGAARAGTGRQAVLKSVGPLAIADDGDDEYVLPTGAP